jgi:hypothetical protein
MVLAVPTQDTFTVGEVLTAALMNKNVRDAVNFLANPPAAVLYSAASQSIPNATETSLNFDSEVLDTYNGHNVATNNSRYTAQVAGWYFVIGACWFNNNGTGYRRVDLYVNGAGLTANAQATMNASSGVGSGMQVMGLVHLNVGDYVEVYGLQNSGAALGTPGAGALSMSLWWVHA